MRKLYAFLLASFLVIFGTVSRAQVSNYAFSQNNGTYTEITGGTTLGTATGNTTPTSLDDDLFNIPNGSFPFTFTFNGTGYTGCNVVTNGFITFGATAPSPSFSYLPISGTNAYDGAISAFGGDINSFFNIAGQTGDLKWDVVGVAPNREIVIQWRKFRPAFSTSTTNAYSWSFQVRLSETSNKISVVYGPGSFIIGSTTVTGNRQVGLRGLTNADFNNRTATLSWYNTTRGTVNTNTVAFSTLNNFPASGLTYMWTPAASACAGSPTAGSISGSASVCTGSLTSLTLNGYTFPQSGITIQWQSSAVSGGPYTNITGGVNNQYTFTPAVAGTTYYIATVTCANGGGTATTAEFAQTVNAATIAVLPTAQTICPGEPVILTASGGVSYSWSPATGLSATTGNPVTATPAVTTTYTVTGTAANGCTNTATSTLTVKPATVVTVLPTVSNVCVGTPTNLNASATPQAYGVSNITFSPYPVPGVGVTTLSNAGVAVTPLFAGDLDDGRWQSIALPFSFSLYGTAYTAVTVSTNGWISMGATATTSTGYNVALPAAGAPNAGVYPMIGDMDQRTVGVTQYWTEGVSPNRIFVVNFSGVGFFGTAGTGTVQALLYEGSNVVEFHTTSITNTLTNKSQAIENATGTVAHIVTGRNNTAAWTGVPDAWRFTPGSISYSWSPAAGLNMTTGPSVIANPAVTTVYTVTATDAATGCAGTATSTINVTAPAITTQPVNRTICNNQTTTFVVGINVPATTYQWQINTGSGFVDLIELAPFSGVATATLTVTNPGTVYSGNTFRVNITTTCGNLQSNTVTLTVNPAPTVTVAPTGLCAPVTLTAQGNSNTYAWAPALGLNTTTGAVVVASPINTTVYTVTGTITATGCQNTASSTVLGTPPTPVITPNPATICAGQFQALSVPIAYSTTFSSAVGTVDVPLGPSTGTASGAPASVYPIPIVVSGLPASGATIKSVTVNGITHTWPQDLDMLLQSPGGGTNIFLMSDVSGIVPGVSGVNYTFDDAAAGPVPGGTNAPTGTYKPTNAIGGIGDEPDNFPAPGPGVLAQANPTLSMFSGNPNGTWNLYITDDAGGDFGSVQGWSITFNVATVTWTPATGLYLTPNTSQPYVLGTVANVVYASPTTTTTYTATNTLGTCSSAPSSVLVTVNPVPVVTVTPNNQCTPVNLTASSTITPATFAWTPTFGLSATTGASVTATPNITTTYTATATVTATGCQGTGTAVVNPTPGAPTITPPSPTICQGTPVKLTATPGVGSAVGTASSGAISLAIPDASFVGATHSLNVAGIPAGVLIDSVKVNFNLTHTFDIDMVFNIKAPNGNVLNLVYLQGGAGDNFTNTSITSAALAPLNGATAPFTGSFAADRNIGPGPTGFSANVSNWSDLYSLLNGTWTLAMMDALGGDLGTLTSWSISIYYKNAVVWTPITGLFTNPGATTAYTAGTALNEVYANPATTTTYTVGSTLGPCTGATTNVVVTVVNTITVTTHPANQTVCQNANATFSVVSTGNFLTYQWQVSVGGGPFNDIPGATSSSLTLNAVTMAMSGNQYRVRIQNSCFSATSNPATLTVNPLPVVSITTVMPSRICLSDTLIPLVGLPVGGVWSGIGVSNPNFIPSATAVGTWTLTYTYANFNNCVNTATITAKVEDCPERIRQLDDNALILYPNPNNGRFNIRVNSQLYTQLFMSVYTTDGQLVRRTELKGLVYGRVIPFDFTNLPAATYMVRFVYNGGVRTSEKTFTVVVAQH